MNRRSEKRIHSLLDREGEPPVMSESEAAALARYRDAISRLERSRLPAPAGLAAAVMAALPAARPEPWAWLLDLLPQRRQWAIPTLAGALAALVVLLGVQLLAPPVTEQVRVHFEIHAPGARRVELAGDFNRWTLGQILLRGPDASGHWTVDMDLPEGRYEYQFLVDGKNWVTDPNAAAHRSDGFGRKNAILEVCPEHRS